jgi:hypothetical protein
MTWRALSRLNAATPAEPEAAAPLLPSLTRGIAWFRPWSGSVGVQGGGRPRELRELLKP